MVIPVTAVARVTMSLLAAPVRFSMPLTRIAFAVLPRVMKSLPALPTSVSTPATVMV